MTSLIPALHTTMHTNQSPCNLATEPDNEFDSTQTLKTQKHLYLVLDLHRGGLLAQLTGMCGKEKGRENPVTQ